MPALGKITAMRVQDIVRGIWFNWDDPPRAWSSPPSCTAGAGTLYVAFYVKNVGTTPGYVLLRLYNQAEQEIASKSILLDPGQGGGLEWTGDMPSSNYTLRCDAYP